jgi:hypothetical protein
LAIDFGTSNTAAAYRVGGGPARAVRLTDQADQMPSAVLVAPDAIKVGSEAVRSAAIWPAGFEPAPKSRMGEGEVWLGGRDVSDVSLVAAVLGHVLVRAQRVAGGTSPERVVLTHPVAWASGRRRVLVKAAAEAGLGEPVLVPEPVAAATHYGVDRPVPTGAVVAVFDFGGGTCDVALLRSTGDAVAPFDVVTAAGEDPLGGDLLDLQLAEWTEEQLAASGQGELVALLEDEANAGARLTLREQVRGAKHALSYDASAVIPVAVAGRQQLLTLTAGELDLRLGPLLDRATELLAGTLRAAGVAPRALAALYLTGGSSQLPPIHRRLTALLGRPPEILGDPKLVVALGALDVAPTPSVIPDVSATQQNDPPSDEPVDSDSSAADGQRLSFAVATPPGWSVTDDRMMLSGAAFDVSFSSRPLPFGGDTLAFAMATLDDLRREFPDMRELVFAERVVFGGHPGYFRRFDRWSDEGRIVEEQHYLSVAGRGYLAAASIWTKDASGLTDDVDEILSDLRIEPEANVRDGRHRTRLVAVAPGFSKTHVMDVSAPDQTSSIVCRTESVDPALGTWEFASTAMASIRDRRFHRYRWTSFGVENVFGGRLGYVHRFQWSPPGSHVRQIQASHVEGGRAFTATVTTRVPFASWPARGLDALLAGIELEVSG